MIDNFLEDNYHSSDLVYNHLQSGNSLFLGDVESAQDIDLLRKNNISTIVTAASDMQHIMIDPSMLHFTYPLIDSMNQDAASFFDSFYQLIENSIPKGSILVHCAAGISRSSTLVISYIMKKEKISFKEAIALVRKSRPNVLPNLGFERQLKRYEDILSHRSANSRFTTRGDIKTCESGKIQFPRKYQILPALGILEKSNFKQKLLNMNLKMMADKLSDKDMQILKIYNHGRHQFKKTKKSFPTKKSSSFSRNVEDRDKQYKIRQYLPDKTQIIESIRGLQNEKRKSNTPFLEVKEGYLTRKNNQFLQKRSPTERGISLYYIHKKPKV